MTTASITLHDLYVLYNPATDLYLLLSTKIQPNGPDEYPIEWTTFKQAGMVWDKYVSRLQRTLRNAIDFGRFYTDDDAGPDIALCNNIMDMIDAGVIGSVYELQLVPITENYDGCNFLLAEPLLKVKG